jgi:hypothetical protein
MLFSAGILAAALAVPSPPPATAVEVAVPTDAPVSVTNAGVSPDDAQTICLTFTDRAAQALTRVVFTLSYPEWGSDFPTDTVERTGRFSPGVPIEPGARFITMGNCWRWALPLAPTIRLTVGEADFADGTRWVAPAPSPPPSYAVPGGHMRDGTYAYYRVTGENTTASLVVAEGDGLALVVNEVGVVERHGPDNAAGDSSYTARYLLDGALDPASYHRSTTWLPVSTTPVPQRTATLDMTWNGAAGVMIGGWGAPVPLAAGTDHFVLFDTDELAGMAALPAQFASWGETTAHVTVVARLGPVTTATMQIVADAVPAYKPRVVPTSDRALLVHDAKDLLVWFDPTTNVPDEIDLLDRPGDTLYVRKSLLPT